MELSAITLRQAVRRRGRGRGAFLPPAVEYIWRARLFDLARLELRQLHHVVEVKVLDVVDPREVRDVFLWEENEEGKLGKGVSVGIFRMGEEGIRVGG